MEQQSNVVWLERRNSTRASEAERLLFDRIKLLKNPKLTETQYAVEVMDLQIRELAWAKKWGIK